MATQFSRWGGLALILAGLLISVPALIHPADMDPASLHSAAWNISHIGVGLGFLIAIPGIARLYLRLAPTGGQLGLLAFFLTAIGSAGVATWMLVVETILFPYAAALGGPAALMNGPDFYSVVPAAQPLSALFNLVPLVGFVLLGVTLVRSPVAGRPSGLLMIGGILLATLGPTPLIYGIGYALVGVAFVWSGYSLISSTSEPEVSVLEPALN